MILSHFKAWIRTASASGRADGASALARAYLYSKLGEQRREAERVLTEFLDDPSPLVRRALAEALAGASGAPHHIILALADDQAAIAAIVLARSPVLTDAELIDCSATAGPAAQVAIASRASVSAPVSAALAANHGASLPLFSLRRMVDRHGDSAELREALLTRADLPTSVRLDLVAATTRALAAFVTERNWMSGERMKRVAIETKDKAAITVAGLYRDSLSELVAHLRQSGQLTAGLALRAVLSGRQELFKAVLVELAGVPFARVDSLMRHHGSTGFAALYRKAGLPLDLLPVFRSALQAVRDVNWSSGDLSRAAIERVLTACEAIASDELQKLMVLLRRFETEAARDEARANVLEASQIEAAHVAEPLLLADLDEEDCRRPAHHGFERIATARKPIRYAIDLAAIEAQLCAA